MAPPVDMIPPGTTYYVSEIAVRFEKKYSEPLERKFKQALATWEATDQPTGKPATLEFIVGDYAFTGTAGAFLGASNLVFHGMILRDAETKAEVYRRGGGEVYGGMVPGSVFGGAVMAAAQAASDTESIMALMAAQRIENETLKPKRIAVARNAIDRLKMP
jgi:hypothetical protein